MATSPHVAIEEYKKLTLSSSGWRFGELVCYQQAGQFRIFHHDDSAQTPLAALFGAEEAVLFVKAWYGAKIDEHNNDLR